jgi:hypothetical protein
MKATAEETDGAFILAEDRMTRGKMTAAVAGVAARRGVGETAPRTSPPLERRGVHPCTERLLRPQKLRPV